MKLKKKIITYILKWLHIDTILRNQTTIIRTLSAIVSEMREAGYLADDYNEFFGTEGGYISHILNYADDTTLEIVDRITIDYAMIKLEKKDGSNYEV